MEDPVRDNILLRLPTKLGGCAVLLTILLAGCSDGGNPPPPAATTTATPVATATRTSTPAATATETSTPAPTATATPLPTIAGQENLFGSLAQGSGALTIEPVPLIPTYFSDCLGGSGPDCAGGTLLYIGTDPGFEEADADMPGLPLYALPDGVSVSLEVISIDPDLSLAFEGGTLDAAGQSLELGTTPGIHADLQWVLVLPSGASLDAGHPVTLKLTTASAGFTDSAEFTEIVKPSSGPPPAE